MQHCFFRGYTIYCTEDTIAFPPPTVHLLWKRKRNGSFFRGKIPHALMGLCTRREKEEKKRKKGGNGRGREIAGLWENLRLPPPLNIPEGRGKHPHTLRANGKPRRERSERNCVPNEQVYDCGCHCLGSSRWCFRVGIYPSAFIPDCGICGRL